MKEWFHGLTADLRSPKAKRQREAIRRLVMICATVITAIALAFVAGRVSAETFSRSDANGKLTLSVEPCAAGPWFTEWKSASWTYRGKLYAACWRIQKNARGGDMVVVLDSEGVVTPFDPDTFAKDDGV